MISAEGCDALTLSAVQGNSWTDPPVITIKENTPTAPEQPTEKSDAPTVAKIELVTQMFYDPYYRVSFNGDVEAYLGKVSGGAINSTPLTLKTYSLSSNDANTFKVSTESATGVMSYLDFSTDCFSSTSEKTVTITADGYKDLTYTVDKDGKL